MRNSRIGAALDSVWETSVSFDGEDPELQDSKLGSASDMLSRLASPSANAYNLKQNRL